MQKKAHLRLLVILLGLSWVAYAFGVPATRSTMIWKIDPSVQDHLAKEEDQFNGLRNIEEVVLDIMKEELVEERRMMMDTADYPGTKPNPSHNPKPPGKLALTYINP